MRNRGVIVALLLGGSFALSPIAARAAGCPTEPGWDYTDAGPDAWNSAFPILCGEGVRQSPINIVTSSAIRTSLPRIKFNYGVADVVTLDHDDQTLVDNGAGNFITIGSTKYVLENIHAHTPSEHTLNGKQYPLELHFVHLSAGGQYAVVGVLVQEGGPNDGIIQPPSGSDPSTVDFKLVDLIPKNVARWSYDGSLTTPGPDPATLGCPEVVLWNVMTGPITMSSDQIQAFKDSGSACWATENTARPVQALGNRFVLMSQ